MTRESQVRFYERLGEKFPGAPPIPELGMGSWPLLDDSQSDPVILASASAQDARVNFALSPYTGDDAEPLKRLRSPGCQTAVTRCFMIRSVGRSLHYWTGVPVMWCNSKKEM
jgi:hypothetical protein